MNTDNTTQRIEAEDMCRNRTFEEVTAILKAEGNQSSHQFQEWWDIFQLQSLGRQANLSELEMWCLLSNRFELKRK